LFLAEKENINLLTFMIIDWFGTANLLQPDLSGALFANSAMEKASGICKKAGTEGG